MDEQQWLKIKALYEKASQLEKSEQVAYVENLAKEHDPAVINKVLSMLSVENTESIGGQHELTDIVRSNAQEMVQETDVLQPGTIVEKFRVDKMLGEGGMGSVYLAERISGDFKQTVAIKVIHSQYYTSQSMQRFRQERQILASLQHKHIASFISGGETASGQPYIILEYIKGCTITEYCQTNKLNIDERIALYKQVLSAVKYAHQNLVVHRDIKPSNVLVTENGDVKLLDFGIAKLLEENQIDANQNNSLTRQDMRVLTPSNASPEQVLGHSVTTRSDVYGLGSLLMHLMTDEPVFDTTKHSSREIETMIVEITPTKPSDKCKASPIPEVSSRAALLKGDLDTIVLHSLQKDPERRYSSVEQIEEDVRRYLAKYPIIARPDSLWYRSKKFLQRNTLSSVLSASLLVTMFAFSGLVYYQSQQIEIQRDSALEQADIAEEIAEFMADLFTAARVDQSSGAEISALQILEQAKDDIDTLDATQSVKAIVLHSLAQVYTLLDEFESSLDLLEQARTLLNQHPFENPQTQAEYDLKVDIEYGDSIMLQGDYQAALEVFSDVLLRLDEYAKQNLLEDEKKLIHYRAIEYSLATAYFYIDDHKTSAKHIQNAIDYASQIKTEAVPAIFYITQGGTLRDLGKYEESRVALQKSIELERASSDIPTLNLAYALNQLAASLELLGKIDEAIVAAKEGLEIRDDIVGPAHIESISSAGMLSNLYAAKGEYTSAAAIRENVLQAMEAENKTEHPYYAITLGSLSNIYKLDGQLEKANEGLVRAHRLLDDFFEQGHPEVARPLLVLSEIALLQNDLVRAKDYWEQAQQMLEKHLTGDHQLAGISLALQSVISHSDGLVSASKEQETEALAMYERLYTKENRRYQDLLKIISSTKNSVME